MRAHLVVAALAILWLVFSCGVPFAQEKADPIDTITLEEMRDHIFYLAADELEGRDTASEGFRIASIYATTQFRAAGLKPMIEDGEGGKTFFQPIPMAWCTISEGTRLNVQSASGEKALPHTEQMILVAVSYEHAHGFADVHPLFLGYGIEEPELGWNDYEDIDVEGRVCIIVCAVPMKDGAPLIPELEPYKGTMTSMQKRFISALKHRTAGLLMVVDPAMAAEWEQLAAILNREQLALALEDGDGKGIPMLPITAAALRPEGLAQEIRAMGFDPVTGEGECRRGEMEGVRLSLGVEAESRPAECRNVVALLEGTDPELKDEYIVVSAHLDHLGLNRDGEVMNGADDNASGCAAVIEAAEAAAINPPRRSVIFVLFTGEEGSALGSQYFVRHIGIPAEKIKLCINTDMIGRDSPEFPESILALASENGRSELVEMIASVGAKIGCERLDLRLNEGDPWNHGMGSDQAMFDYEGIPFILITRGFMQPDYHRPSDDAETINYDKVTWASKLIYALLMEGANADEVIPTSE